MKRTVVFLLAGALSVCVLPAAFSGNLQGALPGALSASAIVPGQALQQHMDRQLKAFLAQPPAAGLVNLSGLSGLKEIPVLEREAAQALLRLLLNPQVSALKPGDPELYGEQNVATIQAAGGQLWQLAKKDQGLAATLKRLQEFVLPLDVETRPSETMTRLNEVFDGMGKSSAEAIDAPVAAPTAAGVAGQLKLQGHDIRSIVIDARDQAYARDYGNRNIDSAFMARGDYAFSKALANGLFTAGYTGSIRILVNHRGNVPEDQAYLFGDLRVVMSGEYKESAPADLFITPASDPEMLIDPLRIPKNVATGPSAVRILLPMVSKDDDNLSWAKGMHGENPYDRNVDGYIAVGDKRMPLKSLADSPELGSGHPWDELESRSALIAGEILALATKARQGAASAGTLAEILKPAMEGTVFLQAAVPDAAVAAVVSPKPVAAPKHALEVPSSQRIPLKYLLFMGFLGELFALLIVAAYVMSHSGR